MRRLVHGEGAEAAAPKQAKVSVSSPKRGGRGGETSLLEDVIAAQHEELEAAMLEIARLREENSSLKTDKNRPKTFQFSRFAPDRRREHLGASKKHPREHLKAPQERPKRHPGLPRGLLDPPWGDQK